MDRDTLYELRSMLALYPYFQTARLLMLQNLYLLHDPTFDEELRRASAYITDRRVVFKMIEGRHYEYRNMVRQQKAAQPKAAENEDRTSTLIDNFLDQIPKDYEEEIEPKPKRKPTPADAAVDYISYLVEAEPEGTQEMPGEMPKMFGQDLIDSFINDDKGKFTLSDTPEYRPEPQSIAQNDEIEVGGEFFTETLARIYIKQGRYSKALEIIRRLSLENPKKNAYFADQIRFLQESKGGGLASQFSGYNQIGGVRKTTDFIEKATWFLAGFMVLVSVCCAYVAPQAGGDSSVMENYQAPATNPNNLPGFGASQQQNAAPAAEAPATEAPAAPAEKK